MQKLTFAALHPCRTIKQTSDTAKSLSSSQSVCYKKAAFPIGKFRPQYTWNILRHAQARYNKYPCILHCFMAFFMTLRQPTKKSNSQLAPFCSAQCSRCPQQSTLVEVKLDHFCNTCWCDMRMPFRIHASSSVAYGSKFRASLRL